MANIYTVMFNIDGEGSTARFEFESSAWALVDALEDAGYEASVHDEFKRKELTRGD
ncbi:hypothetical protein HUG10_20695 (plasmid) [Halorarum halophilum]|uniref:Uncharacterized protein n=1 Tax=Halorarum halophilum TaxID=2743090 RepID=A0A7D5GPL9_9EURY|nr:hypothetical protein [Halobaculum halophilum]QLG30027.1 hypothetical protein HUG10_20695 [Halobaculum halophilum]